MVILTGNSKVSQKSDNPSEEKGNDPNCEQSVSLVTPLSITKLLGTNTPGSSLTVPETGREGLAACVGLFASSGISK